MCGTANQKSEYPHGHFRVPAAADTAAYAYLAKETIGQTAPAPAPAAERTRPSDSLSAVTAVTKRAVDKCNSFFGEVQKSPAYK